jgi:MerR family mercuric resistance operon transcriptional regulator
VRTGEVAASAGVNAQTLRYYERRGLLHEPPRRDSGYRAYTSETVVGFTLDAVEMLLHLAEGGPANCDAVKVLAQEKLGDLETRMESLRAMHDSLGQLIATCDRPKRRRECPLIEALGGVPIPSGDSAE